MKAEMLRELGRAKAAAVTLGMEIRLARRRAQDRCEHLASAADQTHQLQTQLATLTDLVERQKE